MFADSSLASRIDRAEARLLEAVVAASRDAPTARSPEAPPLALPVGGGLAIYVSPNSPVNKVIGLGFDGPLDLASLDAVEEAWRARHEPVRVEMSILADATLGPTLAARGYRLHGFENVLGRPIGAPEPAPYAPGVTIERLRDADARTWIDIAVDAFMDLDGTGSGPDDSMPREDLERVLLEFSAPAALVRYLARLDGRPVGAASLATDVGEGLAMVAGAGTLPAVRGRGIQKALLHRRLADASAAGCDLAVVTTGPGTRSQENVMKRGFILLYTRAVLIKRWD